MRLIRGPSDHRRAARAQPARQPLITGKATRMTSSAPEPGSRRSTRPLTRRTLIASVGLTAAAVPAATLLGQPSAAAATCPPTTTAPVPPPAKGPAIPTSGYLVEEIAERTYWLTDGLYQMIFLVTAEGVVAVDAPPT